MKEFIERINKKRRKTLGWFSVVLLFSVLCAVSLVFTVSDNVHLEEWITLLFALVFAFFGVFSYRFRYSVSRKDYEDDFKQNSLKVLFESSCEDVVYKEGEEDISGFASQSLISPIDEENVNYSFCGKYEGIYFRAVFSKSVAGYTGWLFEFAFSKQFKRNVQSRRKGTPLVIPPEKTYENGYAVYETKNENFNFKYIITSAEGVDAGAVFCEEVVYSFLSATEKTRARISSSFEENKLYLFYQGVMPSHNVTLLSPVTETRLKKELFSDINSALTLALDLDTEKKIWKRI